MAHYAEIEPNTNIVKQVVVVSNAVTYKDNETEDESLGVNLLRELFPDSGEWVRTSRSGSVRGRYAGIGYTYDRERDEFVPPGWTLIDGAWTAPPEPEP